MAKAKAKKESPVEPGLPAKLTVKLSGKAPSTADEQVVHAAKVICQASGEGFVRRGQITLFLTAVTKVCATADEAKEMIAASYDAGLLSQYTPPKKAKAA